VHAEALIELATMKCKLHSPMRFAKATTTICSRAEVKDALLACQVSRLHLLVLRHSVALLLAAVSLLAASACPWPAFVVSHILLSCQFLLRTDYFRSQTWSSCDTTASVTVKPRLSS